MATPASVATLPVVAAWTPESNSTAPAGAEVQHELQGTTFLEAVQRQLGLKLVPQKGPVNVLVTDHVEQPSEN
jgi:uncharacterized protein (TIGR03435 family)